MLDNKVLRTPSGLLVYDDEQLAIRLARSRNLTITVIDANMRVCPPPDWDRLYWCHPKREAHIMSEVC
jgi:hypothetical protein